MTDDKRLLKVFLCHASADKPKVRELYRYLKRRGLQPWLDAEDLLPGQNWKVEIPKAIETSDAIIICLSKGSVDKEGYVQKEIKFALDRALEMPEDRIFLIPARLEECDVPYSLSTYHWVDLFTEGGHEKLMKSLKLRAAQLQRAGVKSPEMNETGPMISPGPEPELPPSASINLDQSEKVAAVPTVLPAVEETVEPEPPVEAGVPETQEPDPALRQVKPQTTLAFIGVTVLIVALLWAWPQIFKPGPEPTATLTATKFASQTQAPTVTVSLPSETPKPGAGVTAKPKATSTKATASTEIIAKVQVNFSQTSFWLAKSPVTAAMFRKFLSATGNKSEIDSFGLGSVFTDLGEVGTGPLAHHEFKWMLVEKANWEYPQGPTNPKADESKVVRQISWNDAQAYCSWVGGQLPSLAEWQAGISAPGVARYDQFPGVDGEYGFAEWVSDSATGTYQKVAGEVYYSGYFPFSRGSWAKDRSANLLTFRCKFDSP